MSTPLLIGLVLSPLLLVPVSFLVEALRRPPSRPERLEWDRSIPVRYLAVQGMEVRYVRTGKGPPLVLLHTLRTQLDIFENVLPELARDFTVFAVDYPGHGWSDIPRTDYTPEFFTRFVAGFLDALSIDQALLGGVSIGASIPLLLAAERHPRVRAVVSINPYDYGQRGVDRANLVAKIIFTLAPIPVLGPTVMRLRNPMVEGKILEGGVATPASVSPAFLKEVFAVGERPGHYQAFLNLIRHMPLWRRAHQVYGRIQVPVLLVYGDHDWSRESERQATLREIPGARLVLVERGGHFLPLDRPDAVVEQIRSFARELHILPRSSS